MIQFDGPNTLCYTTIDSTIAAAALERIESETEYKLWDLDGEIDDGSRRTINYGDDYSTIKTDRAARSYREIPSEIEALRKAVFDAFSSRITEAKSAKAFNNVIVTDYAAGTKIRPHFDFDETTRDEMGFWFGESVLGVILIADESGHLRFYDPKNVKGILFENIENAPPPILEVPEEVGFAFIMRDEMRHKIVHDVHGITSRRVSVTFRIMHYVNKEERA